MGERHRMLCEALKKITPKLRKMAVLMPNYSHDSQKKIGK